MPGLTSGTGTRLSRKGAALLPGGKRRWVRPQVAAHERHSCLDCAGSAEVVVPGFGCQPELFWLLRRGEELAADIRGYKGVAPAGHDEDGGPHRWNARDRIEAVLQEQPDRHEAELPSSERGNARVGGLEE